MRYFHSPLVRLVGILQNSFHHLSKKTKQVDYKWKNVGYSAIVPFDTPNSEEIPRKMGHKGSVGKMLGDWRNCQNKTFVGGSFQHRMNFVNWSHNFTAICIAADVLQC